MKSLDSIKERSRLKMEHLKSILTDDQLVLFENAFHLAVDGYTFEQRKHVKIARRIENNKY